MLITLQSSVYVIPVNLLFVGLFREVKNCEQPVFVCSSNQCISPHSSSIDSKDEDNYCKCNASATCTKIHKRTNDEDEYSDVIHQKTKRNLEVMMTDRQRRRFGLKTDTVGKKSMQIIEEVAITNKVFLINVKYSCITNK